MKRDEGWLEEEARLCDKLEDECRRQVDASILKTFPGRCQDGTGGIVSLCEMPACSFKVDAGADWLFSIGALPAVGVSSDGSATSSSASLGAPNGAEGNGRGA